MRDADGRADQHQPAHRSVAERDVLLATKLERTNLFLVPLDDVRRWWRYHQLFADLLRARLRQELHDRVPQLHRNAAAWAAVIRRPSASPPVGEQVMSPATMSESPRTVMSTGGEVEVAGGGWSRLCRRRRRRPTAEDAMCRDLLRLRHG